LVEPGRFLVSTEKNMDFNSDILPNNVDSHMAAYPRIIQTTTNSDHLF
jgi:hypothetical protein